MRCVVIVALIVLGCSGPQTSDTDGGIPPVPAATLHFDCRTHNIGVFATDDSDFSVACDASALDKNGIGITNANILFLEEAGVVRKTDDGIEGSPAYTYYPLQGARPSPSGVDPFPGEPSMRVDGITKNPRDGLVALVAYVPGDNPQLGDMFSGDPFVDLDDDRQYDEGEPFFSSNGSGVYSDSQTTVLWKQIKLLWTGRLSQELTISTCTVVNAIPGTSDIARDSPASFQFTLLDEFFNVLASNSDSDQICYDAQPSYGIELGNGELECQAIKQREMGLTLDKDGNFPSVTTAASFGLNRTYSVPARNILPEGLNDVEYTIGGTLERSLTIDEFGSSGFYISEDLPSCSGLLK